MWTKPFWWEKRNIFHDDKIFNIEKKKSTVVDFYAARSALKGHIIMETTNTQHVIKDTEIRHHVDSLIHILQTTFGFRVAKVHVVCDAENVYISSSKSWIDEINIDLMWPTFNSIYRITENKEFPTHLLKLARILWINSLFGCGAIYSAEKYLS